jgi:hypothetical protein
MWFGEKLTSTYEEITKKDKFLGLALNMTSLFIVTWSRFFIMSIVMVWDNGTKHTHVSDMQRDIVINVNTPHNPC